MVAMSAPEKNILLTTLSKEINHPSLSKPAPLKLKPYLLQGGEQQTHSCKAQGRSTLSSTGLLSRIKVSIMVGMHMGPMFFERQTERERERTSQGGSLCHFHRSPSQDGCSVAELKGFFSRGLSAFRCEEPWGVSWEKKMRHHGEPFSLAQK